MAKFCRFRHLRFYSTNQSSQTLEPKSIKSLIESKTYHHIPNLLTKTPQNPNNNNPFSFLSTFPHSQSTQIIDDILQSFLPLRPRSLLKPSLDSLLAHAFQNPNPNPNPNPLPLALAVLQQSLRSGCLPAPQTRLSLSAAWLRRRRRRRRRGASVTSALADMRSVGSGYRPDVGTCNYLVECLCKVDELDEAGRVLGEMERVGCDPDSESYGLVIGGMCRARRAGEAVRLVREMVGAGVAPREGTVARVVSAMRADGDVGRAAEVVDGLEREGIRVGFEGYEGLVEGCVERGEFVLGSRVLGEMVERGFVPYVRVRQRLIEGLLGVGEVELARFVRHKLGEGRS